MSNYDDRTSVAGWSLCLMIDQSAKTEVADRFCGYMCYQLSTKSAEFHIARIAVIARTLTKLIQHEVHAMFHELIFNCFFKERKACSFCLVLNFRKCPRCVNYEGTVVTRPKVMFFIVVKNVGFGAEPAFSIRQTSIKFEIRDLCIIESH